MIFKCKNGKDIYYYIESAYPEEGKCDFFIQDLTSILNKTNPDITELVYITGIEYLTDGYENIITEYVQMFKEFVRAFKEYEIIFRIGYDDSNVPLSDFEKSSLVDIAVSAQITGFVNINTLTQLEFSQTFIYKTLNLSEFFKALCRYEMLSWLPGDFVFDEIFKR